jgi:hypothetical protein
MPGPHSKSWQEYALAIFPEFVRSRATIKVQCLTSKHVGFDAHLCFQFAGRAGFSYGVN